MLMKFVWTCSRNAVFEGPWPNLESFPKRWIEAALTSAFSWNVYNENVTVVNIETPNTKQKLKIGLQVIYNLE